MTTIFIIAFAVFALTVLAIFLCLGCAGAEGPPDWVAMTLPIAFLLLVGSVGTMLVMAVKWVLIWWART